MKELIDKRIFVINIYMVAIFLLAIMVIGYALYELRLLVLLSNASPSVFT